jgi:hypothetical protein
VIFDIWENVGWWLLGLIGLGWLIDRIRRRKSPHEKGPTWGLVTACTIMAAIFSSIITAQSSSGVPSAISAPGGLISPGPNGSTILSGCIADIDGAVPTTFKKDYKVALVCAISDPNIDILSGTRIAVSDLFEIENGFIPARADKSPAGQFVVSTHPDGISGMNTFAILVPRETKWAKLTSLADVLALGGKILDPRFYQ